MVWGSAVGDLAGTKGEACQIADTYLLYIDTIKLILDINIYIICIYIYIYIYLSIGTLYIYYPLVLILLIDCVPKFLKVGASLRERGLRSCDRVGRG